MTFTRVALPHRQPKHDTISGMSQDTKHGGCLCGAVRYKIEEPFREVIACHCRQCRKSSGHYLAATAVAPEHFHLINEDGLKWFRASNTAQRGFCGTCGSTLFWKPDSGDRICIFAGSLDDDTGLKLTAHIYADDKGGYYNIEEGVDIHDAGGILKSKTGF